LEQAGLAVEVLKVLTDQWSKRVNVLFSTPQVSNAYWRSRLAALH